MTINSRPFHSVVEVGLIGIRHTQIRADRIAIVAVHTMVDRFFRYHHEDSGTMYTVQG